MSAVGIFKSIQKSNLLKLASQQQITVPQSSAKFKISKAIVDHAEQIGVHRCIQEMKTSQVTEVCEDLLESFEKNSDVNNPNSGPVMRKRLEEMILETGVREFMSKHLDVKKLTVFLTSFEAGPASKNKTDLVEQVVNLIQHVGMVAFLQRFETGFLRVIMEDMGLECTSESKTRIVFAIVSQTSTDEIKMTDIQHRMDYLEISQKEARKAARKGKQPIKQGTTYHEMFQHYTVDELREYCRDNNLKISGRKKELILSILNLLDGDDGDKENSNEEQAPKQTEASRKKISSKSPNNPDKSKEVSKTTTEKAVDRKSK